ncbi:hypothetical protein F2P56_017377 [Juglans regia]|uniref:Uncharacterized protein n=1 Tax=Juglans regia TaxID=51240 RepID=A0A833XHX0_JUGRE|nr:hypothetical protein F2P56_017377 [Juglans regia]
MNASLNNLFFSKLLIVMLWLILMQSKFLSVLMQSIREYIEKEHHAVQNSDVMVFFQVAQFVTSYQYHKLLKSKICMLDLVLKLLPKESKEPHTARILLYKLFYYQTDQGIAQFLLNLIRMFDMHKQPKSDLAETIEIIHKIVGLMENLQARGTLRKNRYRTRLILIPSNKVIRLSM